MKKKGEYLFCIWSFPLYLVLLIRFRRLSAVAKSERMNRDCTARTLNKVVCPGCVGRRRDKGERRKRKGGEDVPGALGKVGTFYSRKLAPTVQSIRLYDLLLSLASEYPRSESTEAGSSYSFQSYSPDVVINLSLFCIIFIY